MTDSEKAQQLIDDLSFKFEKKSVYQHFLIEYDRLCKMNEVGRGVNYV